MYFTDTIYGVPRIKAASETHTAFQTHSPNQAMMTADWEVRLKDIEQGSNEENRERFLGELIEDLKRQIRV